MLLKPGSVPLEQRYPAFMAMFSMSAYFSIPQAVEGLGRDAAKIKKAIFLGLFNNFILIIVITFCSLAASDGITEVAMVGWSRGIGAWAQIVGGVFTILAMLTTYWSLSLALGSIVDEQFSLGTKVCWIIATLPSLILAMKRKFKESFLIGFASFLVPFIGLLLFTFYGLRWNVSASLIAATALSTTSVAVIYSVLIETGLSRTELGKLLMNKPPNLY